MDKKELLEVIGIGILAIFAVIFIFSIIIIAGILILAIFAAPLAIPIYFLWNWLMPALFGAKAITIWQAWGIALLSGIFLWSFLPKLNFNIRD